MKSKNLYQDVYISIVIYIMLAVLFYLALELPRDSAIFPIILIIGMAGLNTSVFIKGIIKTKETKSRNIELINPIRWEIIKIPLLIFSFVVGYILLFRYTNYFIATTIFLISLFKYYKIKSWKTILLVTIGVNVLLYIGFVRLLRVPLI